jgi:hypothetical protein
MVVSERCQNSYDYLAVTTLPDARTALPLRRLWWILRKQVWFASILGLRQSLTLFVLTTRLGKLLPRKKRRINMREAKTPNLTVGEWVEVRSAKEIFETLDAHGKLRGLAFNREMVKFCGKRFRVYKRLERIILESTGELRKVRTPTVMLEGVFCDGSAHAGCDRSCFCFWREAWLKRVPTGDSRLDRNAIPHPI